MKRFDDDDDDDDSNETGNPDRFDSDDKGVIKFFRIKCKKGLAIGF